MFKLEDLVVACSTVTAPPQQVSAEKRRDAEEYLLDFRGKATISNCGELLRTCQDSGVQFQASCALKAAFPRECVELTSYALNQLVLALLLLIEKDGCSPQVREQLVMIIAIAVKRNAGQNNDPKGIEIVEEKVQILAGSNQSHGQVVAASLICAIVQEFSGTGRSSVIGLSLEGHAKAKKYYEKHALGGIFSLVMNFLKYLNESPHILQGDKEQLLVAKFLEIAHLLLTWRFTHGKASRISLMKEDRTVDVMFNPPKDWTEIVTSAEFLKLWFCTHGIVRRSPQLGSLSASCIQQICSMKGSCLSSHETEAQWAALIIELFQSSLPNWMPAQEHESTGLSHAFKHFVENRTVHIWQMIESYFPPVLSCLSQWTCSMIENSKKSEEYQQGLDYSTDAWIHIMTNFATTDALAQVVSPYSLQVWQSWIRSKLSPPDGERIDPDDSDEEEIDELDEDDAIMFDTQLASIGNMSRLSIDKTMSHLGVLLTGRLEEITSNLEVGKSIRTSIWEDIHWIFLSIGHMLADETDPGESKYIPHEIMSGSVAQNAVPSENLENSSDMTVQLVGVIFRTMSVEKAAMEANLQHSWSPQASEDLRWLLQRIAEAYLWFEEDHFPSVSLAIQSTLGRDTTCATNLLTDLVDFCLISLQAWSGEEGILVGTTDILLSLLKKTGPKAKIVGNNEKLWQIATTFCLDPNCIYSQSPVAFQRQFMKVILTAGSSGGLATLQKLGETIKPLQIRFAGLGNASFSNQAVRNELGTILERLTGCVEGVTPDNAESVGEFVLPFLREMPGIVETVRGSSDTSILIFALCAAIADKLLPYLGEKKSQPYLLVSLELLRGHSRWNQGRDMSNLDEEMVDEFAQIIKLITSVLDVEVFDFCYQSGDAPTSAPQIGGSVSAADVALSGLTIILPLVGPQVLAYPSLAIAFYNLLSSLCEIYPEKLASLPPDLFTPLLHSLQLGITHYGVESTKISLEAIAALSSFLLKAQSIGQAPQQLSYQLQSFMPVIFDSLLMYAGDYDLLPTCLSAFLAMCASFPERFKNLIQEKSSQCTDSQKERIAASFTPVMNIIYENKNNPQNMLLKRHFQTTKLLETAVFEIRGLLCMK